MAQSPRYVNIILAKPLSVNEQIYNAKAGPMSDDEYKRLKQKSDKMKDYTGQTTDTTQESIKQILTDTSNIYADVRTYSVLLFIFWV